MRAKHCHEDCLTRSFFKELRTKTEFQAFHSDFGKIPTVSLNISVPFSSFY